MGNSLSENTLEQRIDGHVIINEGVINYYICPQCKNMKRILDFNRTRIGEPFTLECGDSVGDQLVLTETKISKLFTLKESPPAAVARALKNPYITNLNKCSAGCNVSTRQNISEVTSSLSSGVSGGVSRGSSRSIDGSLRSLDGCELRSETQPWVVRNYQTMD